MKEAKQDEELGQYGYPAIADRHDFEFRQPATIAKSDSDCQFLSIAKAPPPTPRWSTAWQCNGETH